LKFHNGRGEFVCSKREYLCGSETEPIQSFHLLEFIERISQKEKVAPTIAAIHVRAVFAVVQNAVSPEKFRKFYDYFSHDYEELFNISPKNQISA
jgi:hypothetical protein